MKKTRMEGQGFYHLPQGHSPHWDDALPWGALAAKCPAFHLSKAPRSVKPQMQTTATLQVLRERDLEK